MGGASEYLPMHKTNSLYNRLGMYGFEYAPRGNVMYTTNNLPTNIESTAEQTVSYSDYNTYNQAVITADPCKHLNQTSGRTGWRVPNQKELVIIRRIADEKLLGGNGVGFMCCTQEYWSNDNTAMASSTPGPGFRITTVKPTLATAQGITQIGVVRCVRDLTEEEQDKTYQQILTGQ